MSTPEQRRILATTIPGPRSLKLQAQRRAELADGLGTTMPVFIERAGGAILVADEIQTGLTRTGAMFACEHEGVVPDLITTAKALAGGMPLAAVTGRADIMDAVPVGGLGGTYAGNPVACAASLGALEAIRSLG